MGDRRGSGGRHCLRLLLLRLRLRLRGLRWISSEGVRSLRWEPSGGKYRGEIEIVIIKLRWDLDRGRGRRVSWKTEELELLGRDLESGLTRRQ